MPETALVEVTDLEVRRGSNTVLEGVSLAVAGGPPFALVGESGSGKTTLLFALLGLLKPARGSLKVCGENVEGLSPRERARRMGLVFQDYQLFPHLTVSQNLELAPRCHGQNAVAETGRALLEELRIETLTERYPHELSGGQRQRVAIARALILNPKVIFFDEPSSALDSKTTADLAQILLRINERSQVVVVSHDLPFLEATCPRGALMSRGKITAQGTLRELIGRTPA